MSMLLGREIVQSRIWIDPENPLPEPPLDYVFTYPVTVFKAVLSDMTDQAYNLEQYHEIIEDRINRKQDIIPAGPLDHVMMWTAVPGMIGKMAIRRAFAIEPSTRSHERLVTEAAIGAYIDTKTPLALFNTHVLDVKIGNKGIHITDAERIYWNNMTPSDAFNDHIEDDDRHLRPGERDLWNSKADGDDFKDHLKDYNNPHRTTAEQVNTFTKTKILELIKDAAPKIFNYKNIAWNPAIDPKKFSIEAFRPEYKDPNYIFDYRYNPEYQPSGTDFYEITLEDGTKVTVSDHRSLPVVDDYKNFFAIVAKLPPMVDSRNGEVTIYFKKGIEKVGDAAMPWLPVHSQVIENGDFFVTYPDRRLWLWLGGQFVEIISSSSISNEDGDTDLSGDTIYQYFMKNFVEIINNLPDDSIPGTKIKNFSITEVKIANNAISTQKIQNRAVTGIKIALNTIDEHHLVENINITSKLLNKSIENVKLKPGPDHTVKASVSNEVWDWSMSTLMSALADHANYNAWEKFVTKFLNMVMSQSTLKNKFGETVCRVSVDWEDLTIVGLDTHVLCIAPHTEGETPTLSKVDLRDFKENLSFIVI